MRWLMLCLALLFGSVANAADYSKAKAEFERILGFQDESPTPKPTPAFRVEWSDEAVEAVNATKEIPDNSRPKYPRELFVFTADWCSWCKKDHKEHETAIAEGPADAEIYFIDFDKQPDVVKTYAVTSLPTYLVCENGKVVKRFQGATSWATLSKEMGALPVSKAVEEPVGAISLGKVHGAKDYVKKFLDTTKDLLGDSGKVDFTLSRKPKRDAEVSVNGALLLIPADLGVSWKKEGSGLRVEFKPTLNVKYGILDQRIRGILITEDKVTLDLPWMIDGELEIVP